MQYTTLCTCSIPVNRSVFVPSTALEWLLRAVVFPPVTAMGVARGLFSGALETEHSFAVSSSEPLASASKAGELPTNQRAPSNGDTSRGATSALSVAYSAGWS